MLLSNKALNNAELWSFLDAISASLSSIIPVDFAFLRFVKSVFQMLEIKPFETDK